MARIGQTISNPRTGQRMTFVAASAEELRIDTLNPVTDAREGLHVHPRQQSGCEVLEGTPLVRRRGYVLGA